MTTTAVNSVSPLRIFAVVLAAVLLFLSASAFVAWIAINWADDCGNGGTCHGVSWVDPRQ